MLEQVFPYFSLVTCAVIGIIVYIFLSRFSSLKKDKIAGITTALALTPSCLMLLLIVFESNPHPDWEWVIIVLLPIIAYYLVPIWFRLAILI